VQNTLRIEEAEQQIAKAYQQILDNYKSLAQKNQKLEEQRQQIHLQDLELIEAAQIKSKFLATVSHELRTPLNAILGFVQIVRRQTQGLLTKSQTDMVERIYKNAKHLLALIELQAKSRLNNSLASSLAPKRTIGTKKLSKPQMCPMALYQFSILWANNMLLPSTF
jgi:signal transduction histidine kinase